MKPFTSIAYIPVLAMIIAGALPSIVAGQQSPVRIQRIEKGGAGFRKLSGGDVLIIPELASIIGQDSDRIAVEHIMEPGMRPKGFEKTDLQEGDVILMADGAKLSSVSSLREVYEHAAIGATVKLGVRRNAETLIASFVKADPKNLPKLRMKFSDGNDEDVFVVPNAGLILAEKGKRVVVKDVISDAGGDVKGDARKGDVVETLNGEALHTLKDLRSIYSKLAVGDHVAFALSGARGATSIEFAKPKDEGKVIIRRQGGK